MINLLEVKSVCYKPPVSFNVFGEENDAILSDISFKQSAGSFTGIAGESGSGKTTLAKIIAGILKPSEGTVLLNHSPGWKRIKTSPVQILFQNNGEILNPFRQVIDIVQEASEIRNGKRNDNLSEAKSILNFVNIPEELHNKKGFQLSGGEQQRVAIARIIASKPELLILDEPFSAQDPESRVNLANLLKKINREYQISVLCISHNLKLLQKLCTRILIMYKGKIVEEGNCDDVFTSPLHAYTKYLLKAENYDLTYKELQSITGK
jgi:peptide/nickel transport system ATP-binding protein